MPKDWINLCWIFHHRSEAKRLKCFGAVHVSSIVSNKLDVVEFRLVLFVCENRGHQISRIVAMDCGEFDNSTALVTQKHTYTRKKERKSTSNVNHSKWKRYDGNQMIYWPLFIWTLRFLSSIYVFVVWLDTSNVIYAHCSWCSVCLCSWSLECIQHSDVLLCSANVICFYHFNKHRRK